VFAALIVPERSNGGLGVAVAKRTRPTISMLRSTIPTLHLVTTFALIGLGATDEAKLLTQLPA